MFKKLFKRKKKEIKVNKQVAELIEAHGFKTKTKGNKIITNFKEQIELETWIYSNELETGFNTRLDVGVKFKNGIELYEAFGEIGTDLNDSIRKNMKNFASSSLHVFIDAFNNSNNYVDKEKWQIGNYTFDVFIGDYNLKSFKDIKIEIPENLHEVIKQSIIQYQLDEQYYFIRFYSAYINSKAMVTEFMINNIRLEKEESILENLNWMVTEDFYSIRNFIILKRNDK